MKKITWTIILLTTTYMTYGQGCSDAGFCSMGAMRPSQIYTKKLNFKLRAVEINYYQGATKLTPTVNAASVDFTFGVGDKHAMQVKVPYMWIKGSLGQTAGLGDISLSWTTNVYSTEQYHINATIGTKIATNDSNLDNVNQEHTSDNLNHPLPMYYQTSLGSYDFVAGAAFISSKWMFATGIQIAFGENSNFFRYRDWANYPDPDYILSYDLANNLKRGTDLMLRVERAFHFSKVDIRLGALPIYRIIQDEVLDVDEYSETFDERIKLDKTTGLALTVLLNAAYHFNKNNSVKFLYGYKLTDREVNPDGLTRDSVFSLGYEARF